MTNLENGWDLFDINGTGLLEIQRCDEAAIFESDDEALAHVQRLAGLGSTAHALALGLHERDAAHIHALFRE